jgi:hypothetical protein
MTLCQSSGELCQNKGCEYSKFINQATPEIIRKICSLYLHTTKGVKHTADVQKKMKRAFSSPFLILYNNSHATQKKADFDYAMHYIHGYNHRS